MIIQIIQYSEEAFKYYASHYNLKPENFKFGLVGLEIRNIHKKYSLPSNYFKIKSYAGYNIFFSGSFSDLEELPQSIENIDKELSDKISLAVNNFKNYNLNNYNISNREFIFDKCYLMGILNVTPDSFSDGGLYYNIDSAAQHGLKMIGEGADIIDIGGESTRPGSKSISAEAELERILPVIEKILRVKPDAIISVDTTKSKVAEEVLKKGAKIINDISGLTFDPLIIDVVKKYEASLIVMHIKGTPLEMQKNPFYENVIGEIYDYLYNQTLKAVSAGIKNIFIDPGIGFGKRIEDNFAIIKRLFDFKSLGFPVVIGISRKSFIGKKLNLDITDRDIPTAILEAGAIKNGAKIIRTHNVRYGSYVCKLLNQV